MIRTLIALALMGMATTVSAEEPVVVDENLVDALSGEPQAEAPKPARQALPPETQQLQTLLEQIDRTSAERQLLELRRDVNELSKDVRGTTTGTGELPVLVGLSGSPKGYTAEFLLGDALLQAGTGDWISNEWRVHEVSGSGVTLRNARGTQTHTMLLGAGAR